MARKTTSSFVLGAIFIALGILNLAIAEKAIAQHMPIFFRYPLLIRGGTSMEAWQANVLGILCLALGLWLVLSARRKPKT
jgi:hypothetical protein